MNTSKLSTRDKIFLISTFVYIVLLTLNTYVFDRLPNNLQVIFAVWFIVNSYGIFNSNKKSE